MRLSISIDYTSSPQQAARLAQDLESAGIDIIWVAEPYGFDAISTLGYIAAKTSRVHLGAGILPIYSRTPTLIAMTAAGLDAVSEGRFILGLGASGPQVIEGWHGVAFNRPIGRTREIVDICRKVWQRKPLVHDGPIYRIPLPDEHGGERRPLKLVVSPLRADIPIYLAALGSKSVQLAAEVADGWIPAFFHPTRTDIWRDDVDLGLAARADDRPPLEIVAGGRVAFCDDDATATTLRDAGRPGIALYVGGMGAREQNFYNQVFRRLGYEAEADQIQALFLDGNKRAAEAAVPEEFLRSTSLIGNEGFVRDQVRAYQDAGVTCLNLDITADEAVKVVDKIRTWTD